MRSRVLVSLSAMGMALGAFVLAPGGDPPGPAESAALATQVTEGLVKAPQPDVWRVFSTADGFKKLGVAHCQMDFRIAGLIRSHYDPQGVLGDDGTIENEILSFEQDRMVSFRIHKPPKRFPFSEATWKKTWTVVTLTDLGGGRTHLRLTGMNYPDTEEGQKMRKFFEAGNAHVLAHLQRQFDTTAAAPTGPAHAPHPLAPIALERVVNLPRSETWKLLATGDGWKRLLGASATIELRPGGKFEILFDPNASEGRRGSEGCTVLSFLPNQMLSYTWNAPPKFEHARARRTWVVVHFDELSPTRTRLRLDHLGFADQAAEHPDHRAEWEQVRGYFEQAWGKVLAAVKAKEANRD